MIDGDVIVRVVQWCEIIIAQGRGRGRVMVMIMKAMDPAGVMKNKQVFHLVHVFLLAAEEQVVLDALLILITNNHP
jgi:hypothetical protein